MIGHLVSLLHAHVESPLEVDEYLGNETLLSNSSQCRGRLSEDSELVLKRLIFEEKKQLIYLQLNSSLINTTLANVSEILFPSKWVWVTNNAGRPLLELDFRYDVYSLTTLSIDVGEMMIDIEIQNKDEGLDYDELLSLVICSIHDATKHETTPHNSVCHSTLAIWGKTWFWYTYYSQYRCCGMPSQKFNFQESRFHNQTCQVVERDIYGFWTVVYYLLFLASPLLIKLLHVRADNYLVTQNGDGIGDGEEDIMMSANHEAQTNRVKLYVKFDSSTPIRITKLIQCILRFKWQNACICRIRRFSFVLLVSPFVIYMMMYMDAAKYPKHIQMLSDVEKELDIWILDLELFDRLWLLRSDLSVIYLTVLYILMAIVMAITSILDDVLSLSGNNIDQLGFVKLPSHLCRQHECKSGFLFIHEIMIHRFSLIWEPKFWKYWFTELAYTLKSCCQFTPPKCICGCLLWLIAYVLSLLYLFPLFNLFTFNLTNRDARRDLRALLAWQYFIVGNALVFVLSCASLSKFILYTIKGTVIHYTRVLPLVTIIVVIVYYILGTIHRLTEKYKNMKKVTFDECISLQKDIDDGNIQGNANFRLVVYKPDGIPKIPKLIYDQIIEKYLPLRESEFFALIKLLLIVIFLLYVGITVDAFKITYAMTLGQTIATFFASTLPKLFEFFYGQDQIETGRLKFQIRETVKNCLREDTTDTGRECEFSRQRSLYREMSPLIDSSEQHNRVNN